MKTALVTGASRGIGRACAEALARSGHRVIVNYNTGAEEARILADKIGGIALHADVSDSNQVREMLSVCGGVDVDGDHNFPKCDAIAGTLLAVLAAAGPTDCSLFCPS